MKDDLTIKPIYFKLHLKILFYLGIDIIPVQNPIRRILYYIYAICLLGVLIFITILELLEVILNSPNLYVMTFGLSYFVTHVLGTLKILIVVYQRKRIWGLCEKLEQGLFLPNFERGGVREFQLIKSAIKEFNIQGLIYYSACLVILSSLIISCEDHYVYNENGTLISHTKDLPFSTLTPFEHSDPPIYELVVGYQAFWALTYGVYIGAVDALICGFMMQFKAQFLILKGALDSLIERAKKKAFEEHGAVEVTTTRIYLPTNIDKVEKLPECIQKYAENFAKECAIHHQQFIEFCDEAEDLFSYLMLFQFLSSLYIICFILFQLSMMNPSSAGFLSMASYLTLMIYQIFYYCWNGNEVRIQSNNISDYVFNIDWIIMSETIKKSLLLIMMRSQRAFRFTAGKFAFLSLETFMAVVRGSGSYFMVLRQVNNN